MDIADLKLNSRYWCWWMHRILLYKGKTSDGMYIFEDFGDELFCFTEDQVRRFKPYKGGTKYGDRIFPCDISGIYPHPFEHCSSCHGYTQEELLAQTEDREEEQE